MAIENIKVGDTFKIKDKDNKLELMIVTELDSKKVSFVKSSINYLPASNKQELTHVILTTRRQVLKNTQEDKDEKICLEKLKNQIINKEIIQILNDDVSNQLICYQFLSGGETLATELETVSNTFMKEFNNSYSNKEINSECFKNTLIKNTNEFLTKNRIQAKDINNIFDNTFITFQEEKKPSITYIKLSLNKQENPDIESLKFIYNEKTKSFSILEENKRDLLKFLLFSREKK